ncbi:MAG: hypothetical protein U0R44_01160 [Candidatus Micrarchaeia archaeon]
MDFRYKKGTALVPAVRRMPEPQTEPPLPSLSGKIVVFVTKEGHAVDFLALTGAGIGSARIGYHSFFANPGKEADILVFADIQLLWDEENMERFRKSLEAFRRANPKSAVVVDASNSPLFKGLTKLHEDGVINAIMDSPKAGAIELGIEVLSILRGED